MHDDDDHAARRAQTAAAIDREDLLAILTMRFGAVPAEVRERIEACSDLETLERLVLVAANVPTWELFVAELDGKGDVFKVVGERFDPLSASSSPYGSSAAGAHPHSETYLIQIQPRNKEH